MDQLHDAATSGVNFLIYGHNKLHPGRAVFGIVSPNFIVSEFLQFWESRR
jgi:hypothetical protein